MLDSHKLSMQLSKRRAPGAPAAGAKGPQQQQGPGATGGAEQLQGKSKKGDGTTTKLLVRNVAFEATRKVRASFFELSWREKEGRTGSSAARELKTSVRSFQGTLGLQALFCQGRCHRRPELLMHVCACS